LPLGRLNEQRIPRRDLHKRSKKGGENGTWGKKGEKTLGAPSGKKMRGSRPRWRFSAGRYRKASEKERQGSKRGERGGRKGGLSTTPWGQKSKMKRGDTRKERGR